MNCSQYRRLIETEPAQRAELQSQAMARHAQNCSACAQFTHYIRRLDQRIQEAVRVPVPENLEARILLRQAFQGSRRRRPGRRSLWALAASVVLAISLTLGAGYGYLNRQWALENDIISVVNTATYAMQSKGPVSTAQISEAFAPLGVRVAERLGEVSFAGRCLVQGKAAGHMVLRYNGRPITLIFIPNQSRLLQARFSSDQWQGLLVPVASGTVAIIAPPDLELDDLPERVKTLVHWNTAA